MDRNEQIKALRAQGKKLREIGDIFGITRQRVHSILNPDKQHNEHIVFTCTFDQVLRIDAAAHKLGLRSRSQLIRLAIEEKMERMHQEGLI